MPRHVPSDKAEEELHESGCLVLGDLHCVFLTGRCRDAVTLNVFRLNDERDARSLSNDVSLHI